MTIYINMRSIVEDDIDISFCYFQETNIIQVTSLEKICHFYFSYIYCILKLSYIWINIHTCSLIIYTFQIILQCSSSNIVIDNLVFFNHIAVIKAAKNVFS